MTRFRRRLAVGVGAVLPLVAVVVGWPAAATPSPTPSGAAKQRAIEQARSCLQSGSAGPGAGTPSNGGTSGSGPVAGSPPAPLPPPAAGPGSGASSPPQLPGSSLQTPPGSGGTTPTPDPTTARAVDYLNKLADAFRTALQSAPLSLSAVITRLEGVKLLAPSRIDDELDAMVLDPLLQNAQVQAFVALLRQWQTSTLTFGQLLVHIADWTAHPESIQQDLAGIFATNPQAAEATPLLPTPPTPTPNSAVPPTRAPAPAAHPTPSPTASPSVPSSHPSAGCPSTSAKAASTGDPASSRTTSTLTSSKLVLTGAKYLGVADVRTGSTTTRALTFTATRVDVGDLKLVSALDDRHTLTTLAEPGSTSTWSNGTVTQYVASLTGILTVAGMPTTRVTMTPDDPGIAPLTNVMGGLMPITFTDVTVKLVSQFGGDARIPNLTQSIATS